MFWRCLMYSSIVKNPASSRAVASEVYIHFPSGVLCGSRPVSRLANWAWKLSRALPMWGVTTQVSDLKSSTYCTIALKKKSDTHGAAPYLLRMHAILLQTTLTRDNFLTTTGHLSSTAEITCHRYLKEVTIYRGNP